MEDVAEAGGWEEHHIKNLEKELELKRLEAEILKELNTFPKEKWELIHRSLKIMESFVTNPAEESITMFAEGLKDTLKSEFEEMLSPLKNEVDAMIAEFIEPFMPIIQTIFDKLRPVLEWITDTVKPVIDWITTNLINAFAGPPTGTGSEKDLVREAWGLTGDPIHDVETVYARYQWWAAWSPDYNFWDPLGSYNRFLEWVRTYYALPTNVIGDQTTGR